MDLSIIFVNWNSVDYLRDCIASVYEHTSGISFEIIVVDNASPAGDAEILEQQFSNITLIKSRKNLGFSGANNAGFRRSSGRHILFLNPDTKLTGPAINIMFRELASLPNAGIAGCRLLNGDLSLQTSCIQTFPTILNQVLDTDFLRMRWPNCRLWGTAPFFSGSSEAAPVEVVSGACLMIKREVFEKVGLFSEDYFMYAEDLDLCYKVQRAGFRNYYVGQAEVIHYGGKSSTPLWATGMKWKSIPYFCDKNRGRFYGLVFRLVMALVAMARLAAIGLLYVVKGRSGRKEALQSASAKWGTVLKTLLSQLAGSGPRVVPNVASRGLPEL